MNHLPTQVRGGRGDRVDFNEQNTSRAKPEQSRAKQGKAEQRQGKAG